MDPKNLLIWKWEPAPINFISAHVLLNHIINIANSNRSICGNEDLLAICHTFDCWPFLFVILNLEMHSDSVRIDFKHVAVMKTQGVCLCSFLKTRPSSLSKSSLKDHAKWWDKWSLFITTRWMSFFWCKNKRNCLPQPLRNCGEARMTTAFSGCSTLRWHFSLSTWVSVNSSMWNAVILSGICNIFCIWSKPRVRIGVMHSVTCFTWIANTW